MTRPLAFTGSAIDRDDHTRADPARLMQARESESALLLAMDDMVPELDGANRLRFVSMREVGPDEDLIYLGLLRGNPLFVRAARVGDAKPGYEQRTARAVLPLLSAEDLALYGQARALADWHARHRFCANCGGATIIAKGGWQRDCTQCEASHFPRTDPVAIMLVEYRRKLLLGRGLGWPEGQYSALAGFIEPGESIEEGVAREVYEEAGVRVAQVSYVASQPWPFPSQLMIGCHGFADGDDLTVDTTELADARWFDRQEIAAAMKKDDAAPFRAPPSFAIAHTLLCWWLENTGD